MAAELWQGVILAQLALAGAFAWPLTRAAGGSLAVLITLWTIAFVLVQPLQVLVAWALSAVAAPDTRRPLRVRTIVLESAALLRAALLMSTHQVGGLGHRGGTRIRETPAERGKRPPVLLIHGILCNGALWGPLRRKLITSGFQDVQVMELRPLFADIEAHAANVVRVLHAIQLRSPGQRVVIVAHSMGGLVARAALREAGPAVIARIITLGTPHHGAIMACRFPFAPTRQMCPDSVWLQRLNAEQEGRLGVPVTSLYSLEDTLVTPVGSAELAGARHIRLKGLGHLSLLVSPRALGRVRDELLRE